jgi:hypothetical protein
MADIIPFDLAGSLQAHNQLLAQRQAQQDQNALAQAVPLLQSDPQNAFATAARTSPNAALKLLPYIKQMDDEKKAQIADRADALGKAAYTLKQYGDPVIRKAVAMSMAKDLAQHGITPDQIQNFDYSDQKLQATINNSQSVQQLVAQSNADRTYEAGRSDHKDTVKNQDRTYGLQLQTHGETARHDRAMEANAAQSAEFGKGMTGRAYNILAKGLKDPAVRATPEYATAWQILSNPRVDPNTGTMVVPDLSAFAAPTGGQGGQPPPQRMPSVQGFAPPNPSQAEAASAGYANRLDAAAKIIDQKEGALADMGQNLRSKIPLVGNYAVSSEYQQGDQAARDFINAQLRRESGAAIAESEFENARKQYLPQPGDSKEVKAQKREARARAVKNMQLSAGNTLLPPGVVQQASPPRGAPIVPQNQGFGAAPGPSDPLGIR